MTKFPLTLALLACLALCSHSAVADEAATASTNYTTAATSTTTANSSADSAGTNSLLVQALGDAIPGSPEGKMSYDETTGEIMWTNGVYVQYADEVLTADSAVVDSKNSTVKADGHVHIESGAMLWTGEHITYNFKTREMTSEQYRTGHTPVFVAGSGLNGNGSNKVYTAVNSYVTTDDYSDPEYRIRASRIVIIPGKSVQMWNAVVMLGNVPVFYFPYYERNIGHRANNFNFLPGYRSSYGAYLLGTYVWYLGEHVDGKFHLDYRTRRGVAFGPDVNAQMGRWGDISLKYYYAHDNRPNSSTNDLPYFGKIPENRQRFYLGWQATPATNFNVKALVNYQSDPLLLHDFFEGDYGANPQPNTFIEANKYWDNWSLDALATPRVNPFFSQIEREPDVRLTGFRQQVFNTPLYYDSQSSIGWYRSYAANMTNGFFPLTNGFYVDSATRADTFHQLSLPLTFFNWLNITPNAGGRLTYYTSRTEAVAPQNPETYREVFNTGIGASFKASALWTDAKNSFFDVDGVRHIIEPSVNYVFVPDPSTPPAQLPQFDGEANGLLISPVTFPDYSSIDSIDTMNVIRFGLRNVLQTKRDGQMDDLVNWNLMMDWRLDPQAGQTDLNDLYSQLAVRPWKWLTFESQVRYNLDRGDLNLSLHQLTFAFNDHWSWGISHWYLANGLVGNPEENFFASNLFYRFDDNWGLRATHNFNASDGRLQEQYYTLYRDLRSWTMGVTFRVTDNVNSSPDFTISFAISLKASPSTHVGDDVANRYRIIGE